MTFILNVLHRDMSILAADQKAIALWPVRSGSGITVPAGRGSVVHGFNKITLNANAGMALGIAGDTQSHSYTQQINLSIGVNEGLSIIRKHMERFLRVDQRAGLITSTEFTVNQCIASFFDQDVGVYFSNSFLFTPTRSETRLHRAGDEVKILYAGTGGKHFEDALGSAAITPFRAAAKDACSPEACMAWMRNAFVSVGANDPDSGHDPMFVVSTRASPQFRSIERF